MREGEAQKIRLGVSACLLGRQVRYDGGHKRDPFLTDTLGPFVEWVPVCPEVEIGLGVPRDTIRLVGEAAAPRLVVEKTGEDLTARMQRYARSRARELEALGLHGYVLKRGSPSCGLFRVPVYDGDGVPRANGTGAYARALVEHLPLLPVEEEGRLGDPATRESFIERVFALARWRAFVSRRPRPSDLVAYHTAQKFAVLAHSPSHYASLGRLDERLAEYGVLLMQAMTVRATRARHTNVLQHMAGFFERRLDTAERAELVDMIRDYRQGLVPLVVPLTLIKHHVRRLSVAYLADQTYLSPHPKELMLRNHV